MPDAENMVEIASDRPLAGYNPAPDRAAAKRPLACRHRRSTQWDPTRNMG
jgi:hypothetical protein